MARRFGRNRSTLYRWIKRWREVNNYPDFKNYGRPNRVPGKVFRLESLKWRILTRSSAPKAHPNALDEELVAYIVKTKLELNRSNFIVWLTLQNSVRRIVRKYKLQNVRLYGKKFGRKIIQGGH